MKRYTKLFLLCSLIIGLAACSEDQKPLNGYVETTQADASTLVLKGYESTTTGFSVFKPDGFESPFYIQDKNFYGKQYQFAEVSARRLDAMTEMPTAWQRTVPIVEGGAYWAKNMTLTNISYVKFRVALVEGNDVTIEYVIDRIDPRPNINANAAEADQAYLSNFEMPHRNTTNLYVEHTITATAPLLNYALEWDDSKKHAAWVAFSFDSFTCKDVVSRTDAWDVDPLLPVEMQTSNANHTNDGFDRGHLCASEDRVYLKAANEQTFYYSNMSPQLALFNQKFWAALEKQVQTWGRSVPTVYDRVYVVKGGTLNDLLKNFTADRPGADGKIPTTDAEGFTLKGLACPAYYFMAVLAERDGNYQAIAFLVPHSEDLPQAPTASELQQYALSIDQLEQATGLDLFCNLPDDLEQEVGASLTLDAWAW